LEPSPFFSHAEKTVIPGALYMRFHNKKFHGTYFSENRINRIYSYISKYYISPTPGWNKIVVDYTKNSLDFLRESCCIHFGAGRPAEKSGGNMEFEDDDGGFMTVEEAEALGLDDYMSDRDADDREI
jgi:hypothetical protein